MQGRKYIVRPLPLKQRTSSVDQRRDYNTKTWTSVLGLLKLREYVITVDHFSIWRRHLAWAVEDGRDLRDYLTQRYASSMVFMSLLLAAELNVLFNAASVTTNVRAALQEETFQDVHFWCGFFVIISAILTLFSLISIFTAWTMVSAVSVENAHCIFRSSIGQYVAELPGRFIVGSIYSFLVWICLYFFVLLPVGFWSIILLIFALGLFVHTITAFSAFGRVIMHTGAMGAKPIFEKTYESGLLPHSLHSCLLVKARANLSNKTSITRQYQKSKPISQNYTEEEMSTLLSDRSELSTSPSSLTNNETTEPPPLVRRRTASLVKFADGFDTHGERYTDLVQSTPKQQDTYISIPRSPLDGAAVSPLQMDSANKRPPLPSLTRKKSDDVPTAASSPFSETRRTSSSSSSRTPPSFAEDWLRAPSDRSLTTDDDDPTPTHSLEQHLVDALISSEENIQVDNLYVPHESEPLRGHAATEDSSYSKSTESTSDRLQYDGPTDEEQFDREYGDLLDGGQDNDIENVARVQEVPPSESSRTNDENDIEQGAERERLSLLDAGDQGEGETQRLLDSNGQKQESWYSTWDSDDAGFL